ncbi:MAG: hypothetical protein ACK5EM_03525 [Burkholderiales bacterium]
MHGRLYELIRWSRLVGVFMVVCALTACQKSDSNLRQSKIPALSVGAVWL